MHKQRLTLLQLAASFACFVLFVINPASAATVQVGTYLGTSSSIFINSPILTNGNGVVAYVGNYTNVLAPAQYVSLDSNAQDPNVLTVYTTTFYDPSPAGTTGTISFEADDAMTVLLNGVTIGSTTGFFSTVITYPLTGFIAGTNTFTFDVQNIFAGPTGFDALATINIPSATTVTPEPASLVLLGTGVLAMAGAARRRLLGAR